MIEIVGLAILVNMLTHWFEPIQTPKMWLIDKLRLRDWMAMPFICSKCAGLWFGLLYFQNIWLAVITSLVAYLIDNLIYYVEFKKR